ncbi:MAG TPA: FAD-dependent oxidoreductase [Acidimicrobiales bacterium]|jgi:2-polyprenyl-6-methoxyphenol hydroxylase-like FAD-dependent oxidoreductase|nr:FAD-dependent oxidoreductase [Acidimicrobiales bacterium]
MGEILIVGGGVVGLGLGMMLARDDHAVTVLERDAQTPPDDASGAWEGWERKGVNQFRLPHLFLCRYRQILETELPEVAAALDRDGALRINPVADAPDFLTGGARAGDERFEMLSGRRAVVERSAASVADRTPGLDIRRGVGVAALLADSEAISGVPQVNGVRTSEGEELNADLVIDCSGRRSALPAWLETIGARPPKEELDDSGFIYLGRHFRSRDGQLPVSLGPALQHYGSISVLTLPADNGTWSVTLIARSGDRALLALKDVERWERVVQSLPTVEHWLDGDPIEDRIVVMTKIEDRHRDLMVDGSPVATGILAVGDAWACTNPSVGRGASIGMAHAQALRDTLRQEGPDRPGELSEAFASATAAVVEPWYQSTLSFDRHRLAEMAAIADGTVYQPEDPSFEMTAALSLASLRDPDVFRAFLDIVGVLALPEDVFARPGIFEKVIELGADWRNEEAIGPNRDQLMAMASV